MTEAIATENLSKHFKSVVAVNDLAINIREGEIYGFLGLNGAGKTTTIRMLLGMIRPSAGAAYIFGKQVRPEETGIWKNTGHLVEVPYSYPELTVKENLEIVRRMRGLSDQAAAGRIIDKLRLTEYASRKAKNLSQGNNQRLGLAKALIHEPRLLILDEPTNGLDPAGIVEVRELITSLAENQGVTVFISSHILGEISRLATRIGIIHQGLLVNEFNTDQLEKLCYRRLIVNTADIGQAAETLSHNGFSRMITGNGSIEISDPSAISDPGRIAALLVTAGVNLTMLKVEEEDLESYFLRVIGMKGGER